MNLQTKLKNSIKLTLIAKSNAMRKSAREKEAELNAVEQQLQDKLLQLSSEWINYAKESTVYIL